MGASPVLSAASRRYDSDNKKENIRKTTILLGDNGTGKSNLLKEVGLATAGRDALAELLDEPKSWIQVGKKFCQLDAVLNTAAGEERQVFLRIEEKDSVNTVLDRAKKSLAELDETLDHTNSNYFVVAYGASRRLNVNRGRRARRPDYSHVRARSVSTLGDPNTALNPIESWAMDVDYLRDRSASGVIVRALG